MHSPLVETLLQIVHVLTSLFLILVILLQQGKGGGLGAAFGGGATAQVFGGRGAGNVLTRATAISASIFMVTSVSLAYISSSKDRELAKMEETAKTAKPKPKAKEAPKEGQKETPTETPGGKAPDGPGEAPMSPAPVEKAPEKPAEKPAEAPAKSTPTP
jgi:preprotein translocase subunit SecG